MVVKIPGVKNKKKVKNIVGYVFIIIIIINVIIIICFCYSITQHQCLLLAHYVPNVTKRST